MNLKPDDLTLYLAIWGATLSTVLGIFEVIKFAQNLLQNKRRLRVSFHPEISASPQGEPRMYIRIYSVNVGHRPIQLISAGLVFQNGIQYEQTNNYGGKDNLPKKLQDGEPYSFFVDYTLALAHKSAEDFKEVFIQDAEGKRYTSKIPKAFKKNSS
jgi:hypothetical protein